MLQMIKLSLENPTAIESIGGAVLLILAAIAVAWSMAVDH